MLITLRYRFEHYESKGELFRQAKAEIFEQKLSDRIWILVIEVITIILEIFDGADENIVIKKIIWNSEAQEKIKYLIGSTVHVA